MSDVSVRAVVEGFEQARRQVAELNDELHKTKGAAAEAGDGGATLGKGLGQALEETEALSAGAIIAAGAIGTALVAGLYKAAMATADAINTTRELGGEFHNLSQRTGLSVEALSGYRIIADVGGLSTETFATSLERFNRKIAAAQKGTEDGTSAFERMGISIYDSNGRLKDTDTLLGEVAEKFAGYEDGANKTALAVELFDRAGTRLIPTLNKGAEGLAQMKEEARLAGIVMSGETADAADKLNENMAVLKSYGQGFWQGVASPIIDGLAKVTTAMREARKEGDGFFGSLLAGMRRAWSETFFDSTTDKLNDVNKQIALTQSSIAQMEAGKAKGRGVDPGTLAASYSRLQELYRQQGMLEGAQEAEAPGAFGGAKGEAPPPIAKPKKDKAAKDVKSMEELELGLDAALAASLEAEREYYRELKNLGQVSELDYRRMLDQQMDDTQEGTRERMGVEKAWKAFQDEQNKEYLKGDAALTRTVISNTRERVAEEKAAAAEAAQILREEYRERARAIQMDATLNAAEKSQALQDLADTLEAHKSTQSSKREVDDLERQIRQQGRDIEQREIQAFYAGIKSTVSANLFDLVKGTKDLGEAVKGVFTGIFDSILRKATDFVADKALDYVLVLLGLKEGKASGKGVEGLLEPVFSAFGSLGTFVGGAMDSVGSAISGMLGGVGSGVEGTMSGVGDSVGSMASSVWGFLSELGTSAWNIFSSMGSGLMDIVSSVVSGAGNLISSLTGGVGNAIGSLVTSVGSAFGGVSSTISSVIGAITGAGSGAAALETLGVGLATGVEAAGASAAAGAGLFGSGAMAVLGPVGLFVGMAAALGAFSGGDLNIYGPGALYPPGTPEYEAYMAVQAQAQSWAVHGLAATGVDRLVTSPTVFVAGEAGPERVTVSPMSGAARHGMGGGVGISFNAPVVMDYYTMRQFLRGLEKYSQ